MSPFFRFGAQYAKIAEEIFEEYDKHISTDFIILLRIMLRRIRWVLFKAMVRGIFVGIGMAVGTFLMTRYALNPFKLTEFFKTHAVYS